jgi:hypothetical protein
MAIRKKKSKKRKTSRVASALKSIRKLFSTTPKAKKAFINAIEALPRKERMKFPHEGRGAFRVYVERESGGKDYYFPTKEKQIAFRTQKEAESRRDDSDIYKVR